jgi:streptogramin lyase
MQRLLRLPVWQRRIAFFLIFGGILLVLLLITLLLISNALNRSTRVVSVALVPDVTAREFAVLPDDNAYPSAVAAAPDGTVYTGSYATGAVWRITPEGAVSEIPGTRDRIGALIGLIVAADGTLLVVDQLDTDPRSSGGIVFTLRDNTLSVFAEPGFIAPNDIAVDGQGRVYVSDSGSNQVWRFGVDGTNGAVWWQSPSQEDASLTAAVTGLAYDVTRDAIIITDPEINDIYRVPVSGGETEVLYHHGDRATPPGFDGAVVTPDGVLYVAALGQNGIARVEDGRLDYIAGLFRGSSDVDFAAPNRLYVSNFDQASIVVPLVRPQLPFAIDLIELTD